MTLRFLRGRTYLAGIEVDHLAPSGAGRSLPLNVESLLDTAAAFHQRGPELLASDADRADHANAGNYYFPVLFHASHKFFSKMR